MTTSGNTLRYSAAALRAGLLACCLAVPPLWAQSNGGTGTSTGGDDNLAARYAEAELVAKVEISAVHRDIDNALSEPGMSAISGYVYAAVSHQVWKGEAESMIAFRLGFEFCDKKLQKGERYLIFASPDIYGRLQLRSCDAAVAEPEAAPLLARLKQLEQQG